MYEEDLSSSNADIVGVRFISHSGEVPAGVDADEVYHFREVPSGGVLSRLISDAKQMAADADLVRFRRNEGVNVLSERHPPLHEQNA